VAGPPGFEPGISGLEDVDWRGFHRWLLQGHSVKVSKDILSYAKRFGVYLFKRNLSEVAVLKPSRRRHVLLALSNLAKFLGVHSDFLGLVKGYGIGWSGRSVDDLVIERLVRRGDAEEIWSWVRQVKAKVPKLRVFMDFICFTGLRLCEAFQSYNLIIQLSRINRLNQYYNEANECLEHYRFKNMFIRRTKKAFISFTPKQLIQSISICQPFKSTYAVQEYIKKKHLPTRFSDIRELHASLLTRHLSQPEIDFLHGRVSANVFMSSYFNPALINDLKERVFKAIEEIRSKIHNLYAVN
jgi:hypothetical protein